MGCEHQAAMLVKIQELEFVALELNLYLDTHSCDQDAINDFNCAVEAACKLVQKYEEKYGPLYNFGISIETEDEWRWINSPWPWEL